MHGAIRRGPFAGRDGLTYRSGPDRRAASHSESQIMNTPIVLTVVSDDHPGIVETLSDLIARHGGNWTESSMMSLAGKFAGILLVTVPAGQVEAFTAALDALGEEGMQIVAQPSGESGASAEATDATIELVGQDRPGIVHEITEVLARHDVNVQELETTVQSASMSGESLFLAHAQVRAPKGVDMERLRTELEELANELMVDISLESTP
jgi:glycine cleavage system regulatory protein